MSGAYLYSLHMPSWHGQRKMFIHIAYRADSNFPSLKTKPAVSSSEGSDVYSDDDRFKSRPGYGIPQLRYFVALLSHPNQMPGQYLNLPTITFF
jgi:hypothetical protein